MYRTVYGGSSGVLIVEVSLNGTVYCGPNGVLIVEVSLYGTILHICTFPAKLTMCRPANIANT